MITNTSKWELRVKYLAWVAYLAFVYFILTLCLADEDRIQLRTNTAYNDQKTMISTSSKDTDNWYTYYNKRDIRSIMKLNGMKYILVWTPYTIPFHLIKNKQESFTGNDCKYTNCYVSFDRNYLKDLRDYDAILFSGTSLRNLKELPKLRSRKQKYVYATLEPAPLYPVTNPIYDNFFNWTWTHRMNSDLTWKYIAVYDLNGTIIGPAKNMNWLKELKPIDEGLKFKLRRKSKAAAWFVSHCRTHGQRANFVHDFREEFSKYGWTLDIFGECGKIHCTKYSQTCFKLLEKRYYFYFSFENSFEEDYVTEKLLTALNNLAVPVVYGGANYSRFMPPGSYLNARELGPKNLAKIMNDAIRNLTLYYDFFRWRNHYEFKSADDGSDLCHICSALNNKTMVEQTTIHKDFRLWWNGPLRQKTYDFMLKNFFLNNALRKFASTYNFTRENSLVLMEFVKNQSSIPQEPSLMPSFD